MHALRNALLVSASLAAVIAATSVDQAKAQANAASGRGVGLEEIVVTARRRDETLDRVPLSIAAFSGEQLENRNIDSLLRLSESVPGLSFNTAGNLGGNRPIIRGLSQQTRVGDEVNVANFIDGVYTSGFSGSEIGFEGLERVEVVRGPQSALYGRNAFAGAINYITKKPGDQLEMGARVTLAEHGRFNVSGFAGGPIIADRLGLRIDAGHSDTGGEFRNTTNNKRVGQRVSDFVRLGAKFTPTDTLEFLASFSAREDSSGPPQLTVVPDLDPRRVGKPPPTARTPVQVGRLVAGEVTDRAATYSFDPLATAGERETYRGIFHAKLSLEAFTVVALSGYERRSIYSRSDLDVTPQGQLLSGVLRQTLSSRTEFRDEFSQDLRVQSPDDRRLRWIVGGYYSSEDFDDRTLRSATPALAGTAPLPLPDGRLNLDERTLNDSSFKAIYGSAAFDLTETLNLSLEARQTWEKKRANNIADNFPSTSRPTGLLEDKYSYFTPRGVVTFEPAEGQLYYASVAKGVKSGGFNPNSPVAQFRTYDPERNWTYEIGAKQRFLDGRAGVNATLFYIDWIDQQTLTFPPGFVESILGNIGKSESKGIEIDGRFSPAEWLNLTFAYAYVDSKYKDAVLVDLQGFIDCAALPKVQCAVQPGNAAPLTTGRVDGNQLQYAAKHTLNAGADIAFPLAGAWELTAGVSVAYQSKRDNDAANVGWVPARTTLDLRAGVQTDKLKLQAFCDNVTNNVDPLVVFTPRDFAGVPHAFVNGRDGRYCGVTAAIRY
jgi:iron complex outermembrane receptor protein